MKLGKIYVAGVGLTKIGEHWDRGLEQLMVEAALKALEDSGLTRVNSIYVGNMAGEFLQEQAHLGAIIAEDLGMVGTPAYRVEAANASGAAAIHAGALEIASGKADAVLIVGGEKLSDGLAEEVSSALLMGERQEYEGFIGADFYSINALLYKLYMKHYGVKDDMIAVFPMLSHKHAKGVAHAQYPFEVSLEKILSSPYISEPLRRFEVSGVGDGAAAIVLIGERLKSKIKAPKTELYISSATDFMTPFEREDPLRFQSLGVAVNKVLDEAKVDRGDVDLIEVHDATSIMAAISLESSGFAEPGESGKLAMNGEFDLGGRLPYNTFGGLKARGNPFGATGVYQVVELHLQLTGRAGKNQVDSPKVGMAQSLGGVGATAIVTLLKAL